MLSKTCDLQLKIFQILFFLAVGCNNAINSSDGKLMEVQQSTHKYEDSIKTTLVNSQYKLVIETRFSKDTIDAVNYKEDPFSSPIILDQKISFYNNEKLIRYSKLPIKYLMKQTTSKKSLQALQTPVYQICLTIADGHSYYIVYGSDYCNGNSCPEFIGIYSMLGKAIYEGVPSEQQKLTFKEALERHNIDINNHAQCSQIDIFK